MPQGAEPRETSTILLSFRSGLLPGCGGNSCGWDVIQTECSYALCYCGDKREVKGYGESLSRTEPKWPFISLAVIWVKGLYECELKSWYPAYCEPSFIPSISHDSLSLIHTHTHTHNRIFPLYMESPCMKGEMVREPFCTLVAYRGVCVCRDTLQ